MDDALSDADVSPGLGAAGRGKAFELKFQVTPTDAQLVEEWARQNLAPDAHGELGTYRITTVYCDTPQLDVFHRSPGYRRNKFRLRRYDAAPAVFLERKKRRGDKVRKWRALVDAAELALLAAGEAPADGWAGAWFVQRVRRQGLCPSVQVAYQRTAFLGHAVEGPIRLTLDRDVIGAPADGWEAHPLADGHALLPDRVLVELKYHLNLPPLFRALLPQLAAQPGRVSKYRSCVQACGLAATPPALIFRSESA